MKKEGKGKRRAGKGKEGKSNEKRKQREIWETREKKRGDTLKIDR